MGDDFQTGHAADPATLQVVTFCIGPETYALDIMRIKEIINPVPMTRIPNAPAFVEGMVELRGAYLAIIDLRQRFGVASTQLSRDAKYIVVTMNGQNIGLVVDRVIEVMRVRRPDIGACPPAIIGPGSRFLSGVVKREDQVILLVDLDRVLSLAEANELGQLDP